MKKTKDIIKPMYQQTYENITGNMLTFDENNRLYQLMLAFTKNRDPMAIDNKKFAQFRDAHNRSLLHYLALHAHDRELLICLRLDRKIFDLHACDNDYNTPMHYLAMNPELIIDDLIPILVACTPDLYAKNKDGKTPIDYFMKHCDEELLVLMAQLTEVETKEAICFKVTSQKESNSQISKYVASKKKLPLTFYLAAIHHRDPTTQRTPLHMAVVNSHLDNVKALLAAGANPNARDSEGNTPLHLVTKSDKALDVNIKDDEVYKVLLHYQASNLILNNNGKTPNSVVKSTVSRAIIWKQKQQALKYGEKPTFETDNDWQVLLEDSTLNKLSWRIKLLLLVQKQILLQQPSGWESYRYLIANHLTLASEINKDLITAINYCNGKNIEPLESAIPSRTRISKANLEAFKTGDNPCEVLYKLFKTDIRDHFKKDFMERWSEPTGGFLRNIRHIMWKLKECQQYGKDNTFDIALKPKK